MKKLTKVLSLVIVLTMLLSMTAILASAAGNGSITITNAALGETYKAFKLFDAEVGAGGAIIYKGNIPAGMATYFAKNSAGEIYATAAAVDSATGALTPAAVAVLKAWALEQPDGSEAAKETASSNEVVFSGLDYGFYVITSTQGGGAAITVTSTNPAASVIDKNSTTFEVFKSVDDDNVSFGDTVNYTLQVNTTNLMYCGVHQDDNKRVTKYEIIDTLPEWLDNVVVSRIYLVEDPLNAPAVEKDLAVQQFDADGKITIEWLDAAGQQMYKNGTQIFVEYSATFISKTSVKFGDAANINKLTVKRYAECPDGYCDEKYDQEEIYTYGLALIKVDENDQPLVGAKFKIDGLTAVGAQGMYTVLASTGAATGNETELETDANGMLVILGLDSSDVLVLTELVAPDGYNLLVTPVAVTPQLVSGIQIDSWSATWYDADGNIVATDSASTRHAIAGATITDLQNAAMMQKIVNNKGAELPETGGIGTTLFLVFGSMTAMCAAVVLVARKKAAGYR